MARFHRQSSTWMKFSEQGNFLGVFDRKGHIALEVACPECEASKTVPCKQNGQFVSPLLQVHIERLNELL